MKLLTSSVVGEIAILDNSDDTRHILDMLAVRHDTKQSGSDGRRYEGQLDGEQSRSFALRCTFTLVNLIMEPHVFTITDAEGKQSRVQHGSDLPTARNAFTIRDIFRVRVACTVSHVRNQAL